MNVASIAIMSTHNTKRRSAVLELPKRNREIPGDIKIINDAQNALEAVRLVQLGARAALVCQLTGLTKRVVARLYHRITGVPSSSGQVPFTDTWYLKNNHRMLDANLVWRLFHRMEHAEKSVAGVLIQVYEAYLEITDTPALSLTRAFFVPRLVTMRTWHQQTCDHCTMLFIAPLKGGGVTCPVCIEYFNHRCRRCGAAIEHRTAGRRKAACSRCYEQIRQDGKSESYGTSNDHPGR